MDRRQFLSFSLCHPEKAGAVSGEELFMRFVDSKLDGSERAFLDRVKNELSKPGKRRLRDSAWLGATELGQKVKSGSASSEKGQSR